jgi:type IV pilus assembly protein PilB
MTDFVERPPGDPWRGTRLGEALIEEGVISEKQLNRALAEQESSDKMLSEILVDSGVVSGPDMLRVLARQLNVPSCELRHGLVDFSLIELIGQEEAQRLGAIPMFMVHDTLTVAMAEPQSLPKIDRLQQLTGCKIRPVLALRSNIVEYIQKSSTATSNNANIDSFLASLGKTEVAVVEKEAIDEGPATDLDRMVDGSPITNLVNMALMKAIKDGASDIHIEPDRNRTNIRYRIDGALRDLMKPPMGLHASIISRIKVIGNMDIAEKRLPQEGRVRIIAKGHEIDLRVSSIPTLLGEKVVIRVLDKSSLKIRMEELGFRQKALDAFQRMLRQPHGLVLVTGPTGSGKTTTLYSALDLLNRPERNIVTVEDPVEYQLDMVNQIQVNAAIGMTFARALRSILRQDPDVIMIGEIRDEETARVAIQAALTGHLVLATLHTNDAPGTISRLLDMGIESYLLSSALNGVVAQRLARTVCPNCVTQYSPPENVLRDAGLLNKPAKTFRKGVGCQDCHNSGLRGRAGIYSVMEVTPTIRWLIHRAAPIHEIREELRKQGILTLREEGVLLATDGRSSLEEILTVTHSQDTSEDLVGSGVGDAERR